jgi:O-glycosyl hydrolase
VTGSQQDSTCSLSHTDQVAGGGGTEDAILADQELLDAIRSTDFGNLLDNLGVVVATITTDDKESSLSTLRDGKQDAGDESFGVVGLLEDLDPLAKTRAIMRDNQPICSL